MVLQAFSLESRRSAIADEASHIHSESWVMLRSTKCLAHAWICTLTVVTSATQFYGSGQRIVMRPVDLSQHHTQHREVGATNATDFKAEIA